MRVLGQTVWALVVGFNLGACGGSSTGDSPTSNAAPVPLDAFPERTSRAACEALVECYQVLFPPGNVEDCVKFATLSATDQLSGLKASVAAGKVIYDPSKVGECLDEHSRAGCEIFLSDFTNLCENAVEGTVPVGGACADAFECVGDATCQFDNSCPGTCMARVALGAACDSNSGSSPGCAAGLLCDPSSNLCVAPVGAGQPCGLSTALCGGGYVCVGANTQRNMPGTCRRLAEAFAVKAGEPCSFTQWEFCAAGLVCQFESVSADGEVTGVCGEPSLSGAACTKAYPEPCPTGEYCAGDGSAGTCRPIPQTGQPCGESLADQRCASGLHCEGGLCAADKRRGESCSENESCHSSMCVGGKCVSRNGCE